MIPYLLSKDAREDLNEIWDWIAADNEQAADKLAQEILAACEHVGNHPALGRERPEWVRIPFRFFLVRRNYWIVYNPDRGPVEILRILHAARDIPNVFRREAQ